jgi:hypothetical protein
MAEEELIASRPLLKAPAKLAEVLGKILMQIVRFASRFTFPGTREDRDTSLANLNPPRLGAQMDRRSGLGAGQNT